MKARIDLGIQPSEFWAMTLKEFLLDVIARAPLDDSDPSLYAGGLTRGQVEELMKWGDE